MKIPYRSRLKNVPEKSQFREGKKFSLEKKKSRLRLGKIDLRLE